MDVLFQKNESHALPLVGKKLLSQLNSRSNDSAGSVMSSFAQRQMMKMGWKEGEGLGKNKQGIKSYVKVKKRQENMGIGVETMKAEEIKTQWWYNVYDKVANKIKVASDSNDDDDANKKKKKDKKKQKKPAKNKELRDNKQESGCVNDNKNGDDCSAAAAAAAATTTTKKRKRSKKASQHVSTITSAPTDAQLFAATGGKLMGRRAYGNCRGKIERDRLQMDGSQQLHIERLYQRLDAVEKHATVQVKETIQGAFNHETAHEAAVVSVRHVGKVEKVEKVAKVEKKKKKKLKKESQEDAIES